MIKKIDIIKFGLFDNYLWNEVIEKNEVFRRLNIIYGRNYSGKTTLSRIFRCLENKQLHESYMDGNFSVTTQDNNVITQNNLEAIGPHNKVRVYNTDFVKENLSWLHLSDGTIKPFTILGAKNVEIDKRINEIDEELGSEEAKKGLIFDFSESIKNHKLQEDKYTQAQNGLDDRLRTKAKDIKTRANVFNVPTYNITHITDDIPEALLFANLTEDQIDEKKKLLKEEPKPNLKRLHETKPNFTTFYSHTQKLLARQIRPSQPITDLVNDSLLQEWVRQGIEKHRNKRDTCGFCRNPIKSNLWEELDAHFSKESEDLRKELSTQIETLEAAKNALDTYLTLSKDDFYTASVAKFEELQAKWHLHTKLYSGGIDKLILELRKRQEDIFKDCALEKVQDESENIFNLLKEFNTLIDEHNIKTANLAIDQQNARKDLRLTEISQYLKTINYDDQIKEIEILRKEAHLHENEKTEIGKKVLLLNEEKRTLEAQAKDESKGAELVNQHLTHFFGHGELKLVAEGESPNIKFKIVRDNIDAENLSEGECSLISFCYFIARMEDEMKDEVNNNRLVIFIDDPISSLDSNHIFFMFSLIESIIAKKGKYGQLFISTHNLEFLKYLKKLTIPKYKPQPDSKPKNDLGYFIIERKNKSTTHINIAPTYLKNYITEFNYLFDQIYKCSVANGEVIENNYQYNFGNNMRKFLEAYLFYKYPSHNLSLDQRLDKFFGGDTITINLINRVVNEYSHLGEYFDRGLAPIDVDAISKISKAVIGQIETSDPDQYLALLESISAN